MTQTKIDPELLISLIENRPIIWDRTLESYKDKNLRSAAWREVCIILKEDFEVMDEKKKQNYVKNVVKKWKQLRDTWLRSLKANKKTKKSGCVMVNVKKYYYHNQLLFLKKTIEPAKSCDSVNSDQDETDENVESENSININEEIHQEPSIVYESPRASPTSRAKRFKKNDEPRQKLNVMDQKFMSYIDHRMKPQKNSPNEDRNLSFFKSLLPTVALFNDDQILEFQAGVISLLQNIKSNSNQQPSTSNWDK